MADFERYKHNSSRLGLDAFVAEHPNAVLVERVSQDTRPSAFRTQRLILAEIEHEPTVAVPPPSFRVHELTKSDRNPWAAGLTLGRAPNNDIVMRNVSVSKLHAHVARDADGHWNVRDAGSSNGTAVNDCPVSQQAITLRSGDRTRVGNVELTFFEPDALYEFLRAIDRR